MEELHYHDGFTGKKDNLDYLYAKLAEEETMTIFSNSVVKALIEIKWKIVMKGIFHY
jgi:hypothetical protein